MKLDVLKGVIALGISALLAYACYTICDYGSLKMTIATGAFVALAIPSLLAMGLSPKQERRAVVLKTLSWSFFIITNGIFAFCKFSTPTFVIVNGLLILLFILIYSSIYKAKM